MKKNLDLAKMTLREIRATFYYGDTFFHVDQNDKKLVKKICNFEKQCEKRTFQDWNGKSYGVSFWPEWDMDRGFSFRISSYAPYVHQEVGYHNFDSLIEGEKKQIMFIRKARHSLACLIRLKNKMKIPGPIQELRDMLVGDIMKATYVPLTQEEIDDILKY